MGKDPSRKPKRRQPVTAKLDDDVIELARILDENREPQTYEAWLSVPWRSGWCAAGLALDVWTRTGSTKGHEIAIDLGIIINGERGLPLTYENAEHLRTRAAGGLTLGDDCAPLLMASARCIQLQIAQSSGGGAVYNDVLRVAFDSLARRSELPASLASLMLEARCRDALCTTAQLRNDPWDRERRAFTIAWTRGLYKAAYSIRGIA